MLIDKRVDPRTPDTVEWGDLTTETKTCAEFANLAGRYGIRTTQFFNPVEIDVYVGESETELTRITAGDPSPTEFYADGGSGYVLVNAVHVGEDIRADYYPGGTILTAEVLDSDDFKGAKGDEGDPGPKGDTGNPGDITTNTLTGFTAGPNSAIVAGDTVLGALEKAQGQLNAAAGDVATQAHAATEKTPPADADEIPLADSAASWGLKKLTFANLFLWIVSKVAALTTKSTPVNADGFLIIDSEASNVGKFLSFTNLKAFLKTYFDTLYAPAVKYAKLSDTKAANTNGGGLSSGSWVTRTINIEDTDPDGIVSISSNQFTLQSGTYRVHVTAPAAFVNRHKIKLRNTTDSADTLIGQSAYASATYEGHTISILSGQFTIAGAKTFEIQHRVQTTNGTNGGGVESNFGVSEVYTVVEIWKVS